MSGSLSVSIETINNTKSILVKNFANDNLYSNNVLRFEITGIRTPLTTKSSDSFKIYTRDKEGRRVNYIERDLFITMQEGKQFKNFNVTSDSYVVGNVTNHIFQFISPVPLDKTDHM